MKHQSQENLREYIQCFNRLALEVPTATSKILVSAFLQRLCEGDFFFNPWLKNHQPTMMI